MAEGAFYRESRILQHGLLLSQQSGGGVIAIIVFGQLVCQVGDDSVSS